MMNAIILAAGLGTRLFPLTDKTPKALVPICGRPLLQLQLDRLLNQGFRHIAVNAHYKADQIYDFLKRYHTQHDVDIHYSLEKHLLNTGGGIKKMLQFFPDTEPVLVHNVDIVSTVSLQGVMEYHKSCLADCTLVIKKQFSDRPLLFSDEMRLLGRGSTVGDEARNYTFCGIQVIQPKIFTNIAAKNFYSIDVYLSAIKFGKKIIGYSIGKDYWHDVGTPEDLEKVEKDVSEKRLILDQAFNR